MPQNISSKHGCTKTAGATAPKRPAARRTTPISFAQTTRDAPVLVNTRAYVAPTRDGVSARPQKISPKGNGLLVIVLSGAKTACTGTHPWPKNTKSARPSNWLLGLLWALFSHSCEHDDFKCVKHFSVYSVTTLSNYRQLSQDHIRLLLCRPTVYEPRDKSRI